ncbi:MAG: hypothetical protein WKF84_00660 [Pyrinomonadaceae bacterium]
MGIGVGVGVGTVCCACVGATFIPKRITNKRIRRRFIIRDLLRGSTHHARLSIAYTVGVTTSENSKRDGQAADDGDGKRLQKLRARADGQRERQHP